MMNPKTKSIIQIIAGILILIILFPVFLQNIFNIDISLENPEFIGEIFFNILFLALLIWVGKKTYQEFKKL